MKHVLYCDQPNPTTLSYCARHNVTLNPDDLSWDYALIVKGHVLFRGDCPLIISNDLTMLDIGLLLDGISRPDRTVVACTKESYASAMAGAEPKTLLDPSFNWTKELPWDRRHFAYVVSYGDEKPPLLDQNIFSSLYVIHPAWKMADFQHSGWIGRDLAESYSCDKEIAVDDVYGLKGMKFEPGDVVLDIGANIGMFCITLAKMRPDIRILAFEPLKQNFDNLVHNLTANGIKNVEAYNLAVVSNNRQLYVRSETDMSSIASIYGRSQINVGAGVKYANVVNGVSLDSIFDRFQIKKARLVKIDAEGAEYEILQAFSDFDKIELLSLEAHWNMKSADWTPALLREFLDQKIKGRYSMLECF